MHSEDTLRKMSIPLLAENSIQELKVYRRGGPSNDQYSLELFYRALIQRDSLAWEVIQHCFGPIMYRWIRDHSMREVACRFDSEENYVAQGFARFWQSTVDNPEIVFKTLGAALLYLRVSLHAAIIDTLRMYSRARMVALPGPGEAGEPLCEDHDDSDELWEVLAGLLPDKRTRRVAYLLFQCGLKPREIVHFCPGEFSDVQEIYRRRRNIFDRVLRNKEHLRWRLGDGRK